MGESMGRTAEPVQPGRAVRPAPAPLAYRAVKRTFDIAASAAAGAVFLIPMGVIAVAVKADSPGPVLFTQERLGLGGKPFTIYKFRSMCQDAERKDGPQWASANDARVTRVGRVLRDTHMDELPQLWNILKGDMSIVGPRPERACFYDEFEKTVPGFRERLQVKPGLTGLAQINGGYELTPAQKLAYDMEYIRTRSVGQDLRCILLTVPVVLGRKGAR